MRHRISLLMTCALICCGVIAQGQTHTITFDTDANGNVIASGTTIAEQYAAWGAHFVPNVLAGPNVTGDTFATNTDMTATASDFDPNFLANAAPADLPSGNVLHGFTGYTNENGDANFWIAFDQPVNAVSLDVFGPYPVDPIFALYGLDSSFNLVNTGVLDGSGSPTGLSAKATLTNDLPISYLVVTGAVDGYNYDTWTGIDNVRFTVVPEPDPLALLVCLGTTGSSLLLYRHKRKPGGRRDKRK